MVTLQTLEDISMEALLAAFNYSFSDYIIPFCLTKEQLEEKIKHDGIKLEFSAGAFENNQLIAFLLHGYEVVDNLKIAYNAGTGVIPTKRGNNLTARLYEYILPIFQKKNIDKVLLEVITTNEPAIKIYKNVGFKITRQLNCFKGTINTSNTNSGFEIRKSEVLYDWQKLCSFWSWKPSWRNSIMAVEKLKRSTVFIGIYENEKLLGYSIYSPKTKKIHQLSIDKNHRRQGVGQELLAFIAANYEKEISFINIDHNSKETSQFMKATGMKIFIKQYEMELPLKDL